MDPITQQVALASAGAGGASLDVADVFKSGTFYGQSAAASIGTVPLDLTQDKNLVWIKARAYSTSHILADTVRGASRHLRTDLSNTEDSSTNHINGFTSTGFNIGTDADVNSFTRNYAYWVFKSAPKFFDIVTWTGNGATTRTLSHNLDTAPRLIITKPRTQTENWFAYSEPTGNGNLLRFPLTSAALPTNLWDNTTPTASNFYIKGSVLNTSTEDYIAYLFGDVPGVLKIGSYTGTGSNIDINCGFTNSAQFVMIKRIDSGLNWFMFDTSRGITIGNDSYLLMDTISLETTSQDIIDPLSTGFRVKPGVLGTNANGGTYMYMAIAAP